MARTIHDTWGVAHRAKRADWSDPEIPKAIAKEMRKNWLRQQSIRDGERRLRKQGAVPPQPVHPSRVPVVIEHEAPYLHSPTVRDIRLVLARLPRGSIDGLQAIHLCLDKGGREYGEGLVRDPFTRRWRREPVPGVFSPTPLGSYDFDGAIIRIYGWLCEPDARAVPPVALVLKVESLKTLVHEVAHHFDHTFRKRRSRWSLGDKDKHEAWAERIEGAQGADVVLPYIASTYAAETEQLERWIEVHAGVAMDTLQLLYHEPEIFLGLARSVMSGRDPDATKVDFAAHLHRIGGNDYARAVLDKVFAHDPEHAEALAVSACILQCEHRDFAASEPICRRAIAADPGCLRAWDVLARGCAIQERWQDAALACEGGIAHTPDGERPAWYFVSTLAEAHLHLGDWAGVEADVARMRDRGGHDADLCAEMHRVLASCWRQAWEEAQRLASSMLAGGKVDGEAISKLWLAAAKYESAHQLGRPDQAGSFDGAQLRELEDGSLTKKWAQRIRATLPPID